MDLRPSTFGLRPRWLLTCTAIVMLTLVAGGCGRKADPMPPIIEVPETTTDLAVRQVGLEAILSWSYPQLTRAGRALTDLQRVEVWKLDVPPGQELVGSGPTGTELRRQLMLSRGRLLQRLEGAGLEAATRGGKLEVRDRLLLVAGQMAPTFWYAVRSRRQDGTPSALSNLATWQVKAVPPAVAELKATPAATGILLRWQPIEGASYQVERRGPTASGWEAITGADVAQPSFVDTTAGLNTTWRYRALAVVSQVWGPPSNEVWVPYPDIYPPAPVSSLVCLPEGVVVHLRWDPDPDPTVVYRVLRKQGEIWLHLVDFGKESRFEDSQAPAGEAEYAVKVVDKVGNESEPVYCTVRGAR